MNGCEKPERALGKEATGLGLGKYNLSSPCQLPGHGAVKPIIPLRTCCHLVLLYRIEAQKPWRQTAVK